MPKVEIMTEFCKGCRICTAVCPKKTLEIGKGINKKGYRFTEQVNDDCTGCKLCAIVCPDAAIEVYKE